MITHLDNEYTLDADGRLSLTRRATPIDPPTCRCCLFLRQDFDPLPARHKDRLHLHVQNNIPPQLERPTDQGDV